jgi:hypothetical protein
LPEPGFAPDHQPVVFAQPFSLAQIGGPGVVQAKERVHSAPPEQGQQGITVKPAIGQGQIARLKLIQQRVEQVQFVLALVAFGVIQQRAATQAEDPDQLQERETAAGLLPAQLRISALVFNRIGQADRGAIHDFDAQTVPELSGFFSLSGRGATQPRQNIRRQPGARLAPSAGAFVHTPAIRKAKEGLDLAHDFATGAMGVKDLIEKAEESPAHIVDAVAAVGALVRLGEQVRRQTGREEGFQAKEALLAEALDALAQGAEPGAPGEKEGGFHRPYIYGL